MSKHRQSGQPERRETSRQSTVIGKQPSSGSRRTKRMTYYEQLVRAMEKAMERHPHSTMVMDYSTRKIVAKGSNTEKVLREFRKKSSGKGLPIIFRKPKANTVWVLANS